MQVDRRTMLAGIAAASAPLPAGARPPARDMQRLRDWLTELHPGLYRYQSPLQFEQRLRSLERKWESAGTLETRFLALSRFTAAIRCGHTFANPNNQSDAIIARLVEGKRLLPLHFRWLGERTVVTGDPWDTGIAKGAELLAIDGVPAPRMLAALLPYVRSDGHNVAKQRSLLSVEGNDRFETFDLFYPLLFAGEGRFRLLLRDGAGRRYERLVEPVSRAERLAKAPPSLDRSGAQPWWTFERRGGVAVLTMPNWAIYQTKWQWRPWLQARFDEMAHLGNRGLVIDLRGNEGGIDIGDEIVAHLIDAPLAPFRFRRLARFRAVPERLREGLKTWDKSFFALGEKGRQVDGRFVELPAPDDGPSATVMPRGPRFAGKVVVLTDPSNSSATNQFAARVQEKKLATLVGGETGGNQRGINGGAFFFATLLESGLEFDLPLVATIPPQPMPDRGIVPDILVASTPADIASGRDPVLEKGLAIAGS